MSFGTAYLPYPSYGRRSGSVIRRQVGRNSIPIPLSSGTESGPDTEQKNEVQEPTATCGVGPE